MSCPEALDASTEGLQRAGGTGSIHPPNQQQADALADEELQICPQCCLPIGYWAYCADDDEGSLLHGECKAQSILRKLIHDESARLCAESSKKRANRKKYGIGWSAEKVPRNAAMARAVGCTAVPHGTCCVAVDEGSRRVQLEAAADPATSVNLEYLALALRVRKEGREPVFSLDPEGRCRAKRRMMQRKRFEPEWLAGTSAGEVMFQADYHLKELSMGEYEQPVMGLRSCLDYTEEAGGDSPWKAYAWLVVRKADIFQSQDGVLIPGVEMGVEAREQAWGPHGLEDARITRSDHPLVRYAERFSHFFDLIAERKSAFFHLRELAKASVLAKFLMEGHYNLADAFFSLALEESTPPARGLRIPQLWNGRRYCRIHVSDGTASDARSSVTACTHGVYGGVQFGLDDLPRGRASARVYMTATRALASRRAAANLSAVSETMPFGWHAGQTQGVDLSLERSDLSAPARLRAAAPAGARLEDSGDQAQEGQGDVSGNAFWTALDGVDCTFEEEDREFFAALFNPVLCDRRREGELFVPPDARRKYADKLRALLQEEQEVREQRLQHFLSKDFSMHDVGPLFPSSWTPALAISREQRPETCSSCVDGRKPSLEEAAWLPSVLKTVTPLFDRSAEDGMRFRVYNVERLEVRTTQPTPSGTEVIGAVFSALAQPRAIQSSRERGIEEEDRVVRVTEYVETPRVSGSSNPVAEREQHKDAAPAFAYFVVLETESGHVIVTEKLHDGSVIWSEDPPDLGARISLAKVTGRTECGSRGVTVGSMRAFQAEEVQHTGHTASWAECRHYAQGAYGRALPAWQRPCVPRLLGITDSKACG